MSNDTGKTKYLSIINDVTHEHEAIQASINSLRSCLHDLAGAFDAVGKSGWTPDGIKGLLEGISNLKARLSDLEDGFKTHFQVDEDAFPAILNEAMLQDIRIDHQTMLKQFTEVRQLMVGVTAENIKETGHSMIAETVSLTQFIEMHVRKEVDMLQQIGKASRG